MSRRLGRIERAILRVIERDHEDGAVHVSSWNVIVELFYPKGGWVADWSPTAAQCKAVTRAMNSFVHKHPQYALMGGQGRKRLYLYEPGDPVSTIWAKMSVEQRRFVSRLMAREALAGPPSHIFGRGPVGR
jgi:hypothetical protein